MPTLRSKTQNSKPTSYIVTYYLKLALNPKKGGVLRLVESLGGLAKRAAGRNGHFLSSNVVIYQSKHLLGALGHSVCPPRPPRG